MSQSRLLFGQKKKTSRHSLWATLLEFESLTGVGVVQRGERAGRCRVRLAAVQGQHSGHVAGTGVERRRIQRGGGEGAVQGLQERHHLVSWRDVLRRLQTRRGKHWLAHWEWLLLTSSDCGFFLGQLRPTECSSESEVCEVMTGLKLEGDRGLSFFLMARICSRALNAKIKIKQDENIYV